MHRTSLATLVLALAPTLSAQSNIALQPIPTTPNVFDYIGLTHAPGDPDHLYMYRRVGIVEVLDRTNGQISTFLDIRPRVMAGGEQGFLGLVFAPDFAASGHFFVNFTRSPDGHSVIDRYTVSTANPLVADPASAANVLTVAQPQPVHNGGDLHFGPDGYLYSGFGDGGDVCPAQDGASLLGKMIRLDVSTLPAQIPPTNPYVNNPNVRDEIWAFGLRNPWRFAFDRVTGDLYISDVGEDEREEINLEPAGSPGAVNWGWPAKEGTICGPFNCANAPCSLAGLTDPTYEYDHSQGCSIIGGVVYRGCAVPSLRGHYLFSDFCAGGLRSIQFTGGTPGPVVTYPAVGRPTPVSFGEDADGEVYVVERAGISKIVPGLPLATDLGYGSRGSNGVPRFSACGMLATGEIAEFRISNAAANAPIALLLSSSNNPITVAPFGTVVPFPIEASANLTSGADGEAVLVLRGSTGPGIAYGQCAIIDAAANGGIALSNALQIILH